MIEHVKRFMKIVEEFVAKVESGKPMTHDSADIKNELVNMKNQVISYESNQQPSILASQPKVNEVTKQEPIKAEVSNEPVKVSGNDTVQ